LPDACVTTIFAHLTKTSRHTARYRQLLDGKLILLSFQVHAELLCADYSPARTARLMILQSNALKSPHTELTSVYYADVARFRKALKRARQHGGDASDADVWIIASALEHHAPLVSHDIHQVELGRAAGLPVFTQLADLRVANPVWGRQR
jgi:predicted nucleic acid-binding protein